MRDKRKNLVKKYGWLERANRRVGNTVVETRMFNGQVFGAGRAIDALQGSGILLNAPISPETMVAVVCGQKSPYCRVINS
jgi:hypothetical protein